MLELARTRDRETVNRLAGQVHDSHVAWRPDIYEPVGEIYSAERFAEGISAREIYVAKLNDLVVGYVDVAIREVEDAGVKHRRILLLRSLCVEESLRGHGIGTAMMQDVFALGRAFRCSDIQLSVYPQNDAAVSFYQRCGLMIQSINMQKKI